ncbi:MAG: aldolase/citrate lyase family protein [Myxococcota bacterium]|nr:aldolase/citrate lyase family protein [Myxococcota bacterium]
MKSLFFLRQWVTAEQIEKLNPSWSIFDLEDGVEPDAKEAARLHLDGLLASGVFAARKLMVRINGRHTHDGLSSELRTVVHPHIDQLILPMSESAADVTYFDDVITRTEKVTGRAQGRLPFLCLLERPAAILAAPEIAKASARVHALGFGHHDFFAELGTQPTMTMLGAARTQVVLAARANNIHAIESPFLSLGDQQGFARHCQNAKELGFHGVFTLTPEQDQQAHQLFRPSALELRDAGALLRHQERHGAIGVYQGRMTGPPDSVRARKVLEASTSKAAPNSPSSTVKTLFGRTPRYGLDITSAQPGQVLDCPVEVTVDSGWRALWQASFPSSSQIHTSRNHAIQWGLKDTALPFGMLLNLTLCLAVEPFSESCTLHLGIRDANQIAPVHINDSLSARVAIDSMRNTSAGDASVFVTTHTLFNQRQEPVFRLKKYSYYPPITGPKVHDLHRRIPDKTQPNTTSMTGTLLDRLRTCEAPPPSPVMPLTPGEVILHPPVRPIGHSENLLLTTLFRNTHPVHFDTVRFGKDGLIVCGGFVQALAHACAERELRPILDETLEYSQHIHPVHPGERIGAVSHVLACRAISPHLEEVRVMTLGLREVDVVNELDQLPLPAALFVPDNQKPSAIQAICRQHCPELENRIALRSLRVLRRPRSTAAPHGSAPVSTKRLATVDPVSSTRSAS